MLLYQMTGKGPALIFVHGFLENKNIWTPIVEQLSDRFCCIQIDLPGYGDAINQTFPKQLRDVAIKLDKLLKYLKIDSCTVIGHSMGVYIGLEWIKRNSASILGCIWVNGDVLSDSNKRHVERQRSVSMIQRHKKAYIVMAIKGLFPLQKHAHYNRYIEKLVREAINSNVSNLVNSVLAMGQRKDQSDLFASFQGEKHFISGREDPLIPLRQIKKSSRHCNANLHLYSGGHMAWLEAPKLIIKAITAVHNQN